MMVIFEVNNDGDLARGGSQQRLAFHVPVVAHLTL